MQKMSGESIRMRDNHRKNHNRHSNINLSAILVLQFYLSIMTMFFYLYVKCPEGQGKGWEGSSLYMGKSFQKDREFL